MSPKDVTTRLGKEWNELSEESKRPFKEQYRRAREQWMAEHPGETIWAPKDSTNRKRPRKGGPQPNVSQGPGVMGVHGAWTLSVPCWSGQVPIPVHPQNVEKLQLIDAELSRIPGPLTDEVILQTVNSVLSPATPGPPWTFGVFL